MSLPTTRQVIAHPSSYTVVPEAVDVGAICWWRMSGDITAQALATAWDQAGLDPNDLPPAVTPASALRRAMHDQTNPRTLARLLAGRGAGWALVQEIQGADSLDYVVTHRAYLGVDGEGADRDYTLVVERADGANGFTADWSDPTAAKILAAYDAHLTVLAQEDVSAWLVRKVEQIQAVRLRDTGGIYFVPRTARDRWHKLVGALRSCSAHQVFEVPALKNDEAVAAILDAVAQEVARVDGELSADCDNPDLGARALETRTARACALADKIEAYGALLGESVAHLQDQLGTLQARLTQAALLSQVRTMAEGVGS